MVGGLVAGPVEVGNGGVTGVRVARLKVGHLVTVGGERTCSMVTVFGRHNAEPRRIREWWAPAEVAPQRRCAHNENAFYSRSAPLVGLNRGNGTLRLEMGVRAPDLAPDELLDSDVASMCAPAFCASSVVNTRTLGSSAGMSGPGMMSMCCC